MAFTESAFPNLPWTTATVHETVPDIDPLTVVPWISSMDSRKAGDVTQT